MIVASIDRYFWFISVAWDDVSSHSTQKARESTKRKSWSERDAPQFHKKPNFTSIIEEESEKDVIIACKEMFALRHRQEGKENIRNSGEL